MNFKDIKAKPVAEIKALVNDLKAELLTLRFKNATGQLDQSHKIKAIKKDIARCLSALTQLQGDK
ncbi:50S ribosomal protein L29 [Mycoplasmopsis californica]|uniref:Large ribosomal subunit protein uL29 n=1 Tax=Mycoplasmopsis californica TaxID=2113 RepID=A0A059XWB1_9BACT|nr:50S ribosomal protein L29 [Mycoplasmopsis californica]AIA29611.1 50S ribosomal protein L29 [Mycoplasmopsis californica]